MSTPEPPVAILVVLDTEATEVEAAAIRTALRMWNHVVDVRPVSRDNRQAIAESRARHQAIGELEPIFEGLKREITSSLEAATESLSVLDGHEPHDPIRAAELYDAPAPRAGS